MKIVSPRFPFSRFAKLVALKKVPYSIPAIMIMASHRIFSGQNKRMPDQIKFGQTNLLNGNFIESIENNECPDKFWSLS